jgi:hypothetical protein
MPSFRIIPGVSDSPGVRVEVTKVGVPTFVVPGFSDEAEARAWIDVQMQMRAKRDAVGGTDSHISPPGD